MLLDPPEDLQLFKPFQLFEVSECDKIIETTKKQAKPARSLVQGGKEVKIRTSFTYWFEPTFPYESMQKYFAPFKDQGYDVTWIQRPFQVGRYEFGQHFDWHYDQFKGKRSMGRILTLTCTLQKAKNAFFETKDHSWDLEQGQAVIIPANVLHRATAPTAGTRWSFTVWGAGPFNKINRRPN